MYLTPSKNVCWINSHDIATMDESYLFPKKVKLGPASVGFLESEIDDWIAARAAERESV